MSNKLTYKEIIEMWVRDFKDTMDYDNLQAGNRSGDEPAGIKIIFDGYGYNEDTGLEDDDKNIMAFAIFVHKDSPSGEFPEHDESGWSLIHRPKEEAWIRVIYEVDRDFFEIMSLEDYDSTELDHALVYELVEKVYKNQS